VGHHVLRRKLRAALDRELEYLPSEAELSARKSAPRGLPSPEISVLMAHCKIHMSSDLLDADLPEDDALAGDNDSAHDAGSRRTSPW